MKVLIIDDEQSKATEFSPNTPQGMVIADYIAALRSLGRDDEQIGQALLDCLGKGLPL